MGWAPAGKGKSGASGGGGGIVLDLNEIWDGREAAASLRTPKAHFII